MEWAVSINTPEDKYNPINVNRKILFPDPPETWSIGLIYGFSGSGKSLILTNKFNLIPNLVQLPLEKRPIDIIPEELLITVS